MNDKTKEFLGCLEELVSQFAIPLNGELHSGGLDALAGAMHLLAEHGRMKLSHDQGRFASGVFIK